MIFRRPQRIVLLKLAAIGDVTMACQALLRFEESYDASKLEFHWIIDENLLGLAKALLEESSLKLEWHAVSATRLFQGSVAQKALEAARIYKVLAKTRPQASLLFHRDRRYSLLFRLPFQAWPLPRIFQVPRGKLHELDLYAAIFSKFAAAMKIPSRLAPKASLDGKAPKTAVTNKIGILVGGAQNSKVVFPEKRWPRTEELIADLLESTSSGVVLFGGPGDRAQAAALMERLRLRKLDLSRVESLVGTLPLERLPAQLSNLRAFVSVDSGLAHIAAAVMRQKSQKVITLFGPTDPNTWRPRTQGSAQTETLYKATPCSPCYKDDGNFRPCLYSGEKFQYCMTSISAQDVLQALELKSP